MRFPEGAFSLCDQMTGHSNKPSDISRCLPSSPPGICEAARALRDGRVPSTSSALPWLSSYGGGVQQEPFRPSGRQSLGMCSKSQEEQQAFPRGPCPVRPWSAVRGTKAGDQKHPAGSLRLGDNCTP